ncbi:MAG: sugar ABC transporter permease [Clostridia bacterium]|nr:sugar ABC transporter permease [Clostridia bacterium]
MAKASRTGAVNRPRRQIAPYLFILPFLISFLAFFLMPVIYSIVISLMKYKGYGTMKYVGVDNYRRLLTYGAMWNSLLNTLEYFVLGMIPVMIFAFLLAVVVRSNAMARWQRVYKPLIFLPQVCAVVASALVFKVIFGTNVGAINQVLGTSINFLGDSKLMKLPVICMLIWRNTGWYFIIFLSGLTTISDDLIEAAKIDGASSAQTMFYVTIPVMKPIFMLTFITYAIGAFKLYTEPNLILAKEEAPLAVAPFVNMITTNINSGALGMACAAGWILVVIIMLLTLAQMRMFKEGQ